MNKKIIFYATATIAALCIGFTSCHKSANSPNSNSGADSVLFGVKTGTVTYVGPDYEYSAPFFKIYWDNYGKQFCWQGGVSDSTGGNVVTVLSTGGIMDETTGKAYALLYTANAYSDDSLSDVQSQRSQYIFDESQYASSSLYTKSTQTIAGEPCTIYSWPGLLDIGGWNNILFLQTALGMNILQAISFSNTVPAGIFNIPAGFTKQ
jgi:hypothetical protein